MQVIVSDLAAADIEAIADFIALDNPQRAASFARELGEACLGLADGPFRFAQLEDYAHRRYRRRIHGRYAIIYRVDGDDVIIVRVLSSLMEMHEALEN